jgi:SecD/SecF fusion protein
MQNKGAIKFFAISLALVSLFHLLFTYHTKRIEDRAKEYATNDEAKELATQLANGSAVVQHHIEDSIFSAREKFYLDSVGNDVIFNVGVKQYTYKECKERELNLGLDLKGGMNVMLEVSVVDIVRALSDYSTDPTFNKAIEMAIEKQKESDKDFVTLFYESFQEVDANAQLRTIFSTRDLRGKVSFDTPDDEVLSVIREETEEAYSRTLHILRTRIDKFGVAQPNIQPLPNSNRVLVELPGIKDKARVRKLLQGTAHLEFWETYRVGEVSQYLDAANTKLKDILPSEKEKANVEAAVETETVADSTNSLLDQVENDTLTNADQENDLGPLYNIFRPHIYFDGSRVVAGSGAPIGFSETKDTAKVNAYLRAVKDIFPRGMKFAWNYKGEVIKEGPTAGKEQVTLYALRASTRDNSAALDGDVVVNANQDYDQSGNVVVDMAMNAEGATQWKRITTDAADAGNREIAIVLDDYVYSAPSVNGPIPGGRSQISGQFTVSEGQDLANILKSGKLPAPARIVQEEVVGPSMGKEAISNGLNSFILAFVLVLVFMVLYYSRAGLVSDFALLTNIFFMFGVLSALGAVLTMPGIAGIILTVGMAVDANVIIFERIKEEIRQGKGVSVALKDGYKAAYSAILDGNITTLLTGIVLYVFGSGPVQGFATTLIIGIISSLFTAILISRVIFAWMLDKNMKVTFFNNVTKDAFSKINIDFIGKRKIFYIISAVVLLIGVVSLATRGLNQGVDFSGGRTYVVRFDQDVKTTEIRKALEVQFEDAPEVKTYGPSRQVKITTKYLIDNNSTDADGIVEDKLYEGVKGFYVGEMTKADFFGDSDGKLIGRMASTKVGPTIADDLMRKSSIALTIALVIIFGYIAARFRKCISSSGNIGH